MPALNPSHDTTKGEYGYESDKDKTVPKEPRPLVQNRHRMRAQALTGDPTGESPTDNGYFWQGLDIEKYRAKGILPS